MHANPGCDSGRRRCGEVHRFIKPDDGSADLFAHHSSIKVKGFRALKENQRVEYQVQQGQKGPQAVEIEPLG